MVSICMVGAGSWASALCKLLSENGYRVNWWFHKQADAAHFGEVGHNPRYLSDVAYDLNLVRPYTSLKKALEGTDLGLLAVPSAFLEGVLQELAPEDLAGKTWVSAIKGILPKKAQLVTEYLHEEFRVPKDRMAVVAGPCHAEEIALERQSYLTVAAYEPDCCQNIGPMLQNRYVVARHVDDLFGIEYAAVMKNIYAIACGMAHGLNYGDNFQAVLVSNALREMRQLLQLLYPKARDITLSAYMGDLLVTCYSQFSRNRTFGGMLGRGYSVQSAQMEMNMIAEGYYATDVLYKLQLDQEIHLPILETVYRASYEHQAPSRLFELLKAQLS